MSIEMPLTLTLEQVEAIKASMPSVTTTFEDMIKELKSKTEETKDVRLFERK